MDNVKSNITRHNHRLLIKTPTVPKPKECDCRKSNVCPLNEKYLTSNVVYKAEITTPHDGTTKEYIGMTSTEFKVRYRNHKKSFNKPTYSSDTELSKYVWDLKDKKREYSIKWSILKRAAAYVPGGRRCNLCIEEKLEIMKSDKTNLFRVLREMSPSRKIQRREIRTREQTSQRVDDAIT